ncbi:MAG: hypothetical protein KDK27_19715, partial [Leptospiraceae bacterium]|nr:hypothetical protein [Leptospiraceae bacterium]
TYEQLATEEGDAAERIYDVSRDAADLYNTFLNANRGKSFTELLQIANQNVTNTERTLNSGRTGYAYETAADLTYEKWMLVRDWLIGYRPDIDYVNTVPEADDMDQRTVDEKWDIILGRAADLVEDSNFYADFQAGIPGSNTDGWVNDYRTDRQGRIAALNTLLATGDGGLLAAYNALSADDRDVLLSYGGIITDNPSELRASLSRVRRQMQLDVLRLETDFRAIYLRERAIVMQRELPGLERRFAELDRQKREAESERALLRADLTAKQTELADAIANTEPADVIDRLTDERDWLQDRIAVLDARITAVTPEYESVRDQYRQAANVLREVENPGSTGMLASGVGDLLRPERTGIDVRTEIADRISAIGENRTEERDALQARLDMQDFGATVMDRLKGVIGFYRTDTTGQLIRTADGQPIVSDEFSALGATAPDDDLIELIGGSQTGTDLEKFANRITD